MEAFFNNSGSIGDLEDITIPENCKQRLSEKT